MSPAVLTAVTVGAMLAGTMSVAWALFLSPHDLSVVTTVCGAAAAASTVTALLLARWVIGVHRALERAAAPSRRTTPSSNPRCRRPPN